MKEKTFRGFSTKNLFLSTLVLAVVVALVSADDHAGENDLYFSFMLSRPLGGGTVEQDTSGVRAAVDIALDMINNDTNLLRTYRLKYQNELNSQCESTAALDAFFSDITTVPPNKVFLLGCGCSISTAPVGEISHFWEIVHMSYASLTPLISDKVSFPNVFSVLPSALSYAPVIRGIMNAYGWRRLVILSQLENEFTALSEELSMDGTNVNGEDDVTVISFHTDENVADIDSLFNTDPDRRIYFLNMYERHARRVICQAYHENIMYPNYLFIIPGTYQNNWWNYTDVSCTASQMERVLNHSLVILTHPTASSGTTPTDVQLTLNEFQALYEEENDSDSTFAAPFAYDALWAMAIAMNRSGANFSSFDNGQEIGRKISNQVKAQLKTLSFVGLTGSVSFDSNGTRQEEFPRVMQYRFTDGTSSASNPLVLIGLINASVPIMQYVENQSNDTVWPITVPFDGSPLTELRGVLLPLFVYLYILTAIGMIVAIGCFIANFALRNRKIIRLTSPNLNNLIILGCMMMMSSIFFYAYPFPDYNVLYAMCIIRTYTQNVGYMLCFGTICAKMGRVYAIFHNPSPNRKRRSIQDWHLLLIVLGLASIDIVISTVALAVDSYRPRAVTYRESPTDHNEYGILIRIQSLVCDSERAIIWIVVLFLTKFIVQAAAVFFAFRTRKVKIKALNDAKNVAVVIYVTTGLLTILLISAVALGNFLNADAGVFGSGLIVVPVTVLLLIFIPKWHRLRLDPEGKNIFEKGNSQPTFSSMPGGPTEQEMRNRIEELEQRLGKHEVVTPFLSRKRFHSSAAELTSSTTGLLRNTTGGPRGVRSLSYSPGPGAVDVTKSLPSPQALYSPSSFSNGGTRDSGAGTMNSTQSESGNSSPLTTNPPLITVKIDEAEEFTQRDEDACLTDSTKF